MSDPISLGESCKQILAARGRGRDETLAFRGGLNSINTFLEKIKNKNTFTNSHEYHNSQFKGKPTDCQVI